MSEDDKCGRCGLKETFAHLLWECGESRRVWFSFNAYLTNINITEGKVEDYEDIFKIGKNRNINMLKIRTIQTFIQIERPTGWSMSKIQRLAIDLKLIELYNSAAKHKLDETKMMWEEIS